MKTNAITFKEGKAFAVCEEIPKEPKYSDYVEHTKYYWQVNKYERKKRDYESALQRVKDNAILIREEDQEKIGRLLGLSGTYSKSQDNKFYPLSVEVDIIEVPEYPTSYAPVKRLARIVEEPAIEKIDRFIMDKLIKYPPKVEEPEEKKPIEKKPEPRIFLLNKGLGDLVLNPHKPHTEWVYASDAIKEYANFKDSEVEDQESQSELFRQVVELFNHQHKLYGRPDYQLLKERFSITRIKQ